MELMMTVRYLDELAALGVTIPDAAVNARNVYDEALRAASRQPSNDLKAALEAGDVTPGNVAVLVHQAASDLSAQQHAHAIVADLNLTLNRIIRQALRDDQQRIVADLRATFEPAAEAVTKAAEHFGPGTTADDVISAPAAVIKAWKDVSTHSRTLDAVSAAYRGLLNDVMRALPDDLVSLLRHRHRRPAPGQRALPRPGALARPRTRRDQAAPQRHHRGSRCRGTG